MRKLLVWGILLALAMLSGCISICNGREVSTFTWCSDYTTAAVKCELCGETTTYFNSYVYHDGWSNIGVRMSVLPQGWTKTRTGYYHNSCLDAVERFLNELYRKRGEVKSIIPPYPYMWYNAPIEYPMLPQGGKFYLNDLNQPISKDEFDKKTGGVPK